MRDSNLRKTRGLLLILIVVISFFLYMGLVHAANLYTNSAHGDSSDGVKRSASGFPTDYPQGFCAHCHEQHASIGGSEPAPDTGDAAGPDQYLLFDQNYTSQTANFCLDCHTGSGSYQTGDSIVNRSYSHRAGGWTADPLDDILEAFSSSVSSHNLGDISTFITGQWGYTSDSNPCIACHNPHAAQGDPLGAPTSAKSSGTRGWPVSRPSLHSMDNNSWGLWGDASGEKMSDYTASYQAPYRFDSTDTYEPDGSTTQDGSNLTDFNTFCTDCHNASNTIASTALGTLRTIDWANEKHGKGNADVAIEMDSPYSSTLGKVTACTDCHEPHGSTNQVLIREEVNGGVLGTITTIASSSASAPAPGPGDDNTELGYLCQRCHYGSNTKADNCYIHHTSGDAPYPGPSGRCKDCHYDRSGGGSCTSSVTKISCNNCHFHGSDDSWAPSWLRTNRPTF